jgi:hypothetical protein
MKRRILIVVLLLLVAFGAFAQFSLQEYQNAFQSFTNGVANSLPFNTTIGLNWSDAYIGQLIALPPHFGVGITLGATTIPISAIQGVLTAFNIDLASDPNLSFLTTTGVPIPAYTVDARIGGFILPFDIGVKIGYIPPDAIAKMGFSFDANYLLIGADLRYALLEDKGFLPGISIGAGFNYMNGSISVPGILGNNIDITSVTIPVTGPTYQISLTDPTLSFNWDAKVIDLKAQISKNLFIITPYLGLGASYGISSAGGGLSSTVVVTPAPTQAEMDLLTQFLASQGVSLSDQGFLFSADTPPGWAFRVFGGLSLNILILKLDVDAMYNFTSGSFGASLGLRVQL